MTMMRETHRETVTETQRQRHTERDRDTQREEGGSVWGEGESGGETPGFCQVNNSRYDYDTVFVILDLCAEVLISPNPNRKLFYVNNPPVLMQAKHFSFTR